MGHTGNPQDLANTAECEQGKQPEQALELLKAMQQQGVMPNVQ